MRTGIGNDRADRLGAERTPKLLVLDGSRAVLYRGPVDDQYAIGIHRPSPTRHVVVDALEGVSEAVDGVVACRVQ